MAYQIFITPTALNDIDHAVNYYNGQKEFLGFDFVDSFDKRLSAIQLAPKAASVKYKNVRFKVMNKFPFNILYNINEKDNTINILRVLNTSQNPFW